MNIAVTQKNLGSRCSGEEECSDDNGLCESDICVCGENFHDKNGVCGMELLFSQFNCGNNRCNRVDGFQAGQQGPDYIVQFKFKSLKYHSNIAK